MTGTNHAESQYKYHISWHYDGISKKRNNKSKYKQI